MSHDAGLPDPTRPLPGRRDAESVAGRIEPPVGPAAEVPEVGLPPGLSAAPDLGALLRALRRRWVAAVCLGGGLAAVAALAAWYLMSPKYTAFARVRVLYDPRILQGGAPSDFRTYIRTQAQQLYNRNVISAALKSDAVKRLNLEAVLTDPAQYIDEELKVEHPDDSEIITASLACFDPTISVTLLKAITDAYMDQIVYAEDRVKARKVTALEKAYSDALQALKVKKESLDKLAQEQGSTDPVVLAQNMSEVQSRMMFVQQRHSDLALQIINAQADIDYLNERERAAKDTTVAPPNLRAAYEADQPLRDMRRAADQLDGFLQEMQQRGGDVSGPTASLAASRLAQLRVRMERRRQAIEEEVRARPPTEGTTREPLPASRAQLVKRLAGLQAMAKTLEDEFAKLDLQKAKLGRRSTEVEQMRNQTDAQQATVNDIGKELDKERVELAAPSRISVIQEAELQKKDIKKQVMVTAVAPLMVLCAVCLALALAEYRQRRVLRASEVARGLGIPVVGAVPELANLEQHVVRPDGSTELEGHPVLESIDAIRTRLLHGGDRRAVLVTSAGPGEGKTTLAAHLAGSLARAGRKTLLVDGDLRNPAGHQLFEMPNEPGFSEVLLGEVDLADAVRPTPLDGLSFLAAGQWDREVMQSLARGGLEGIFERLREEFDFLVFDSHPVLAATDSLLLGQQADAVILSVLREVSQMPRVWSAAQRLVALDIRVLGAVVNAADPEEALPMSAGRTVAA
jgi:capsular exopolysaccharide synthesis family protein